MFLLHCHKFIYIFEKIRSAKVFSNAKGNRSAGNLFHYISKKNIAFFQIKLSISGGLWNCLVGKPALLELK